VREILLDALNEFDNEPVYIEPFLDDLMNKIRPYCASAVILEIASILEDDEFDSFDNNERAIQLIKKWMGDAI